MPLVPCKAVSGVQGPLVHCAPWAFSYISSYHQGSPSRLLQWISYANTGGMCLCYSVCISSKTGIYSFKFTVFMPCTICIYQCVCSSCKHGSNKSVNTSKNNSACHKICITTRLKLPWISSIHSLTFILLFFSPSHMPTETAGKKIVMSRSRDVLFSWLCQMIQCVS